jgi:transcriptional regulator with XRE-family HTH domain
LPTAAGTYRQKSLWLQSIPPASVASVDDSAAATFKRTLGATILALRVDNNVGSQADLAQELTERGAPVHESTIRRWENGGSAPDAWELSRLCEVFGVEPADLLRPEELSDREIRLYRRASRQVRRSIDRQREVS